MRQEKKARYSIYPSALNKLVKQARSKMPAALAKRMGDQDILKRLLEGGEAAVGSNTWMVLAEEHFWGLQESVTVFPSHELLENLRSAHFRIDSSAGYELPFESFILALPLGFETGGVVLPSLLVTWLTDQVRHERVYAELCRHAGCGSRAYSGQKPEERWLSITYRADESSYSRTLLCEHDLPSLLSSRGLDDFKREVGKYSGGISLSDTEAAIQYRALKLVGSIGVYNLATDGDKLAPGYPEGSTPKIDGRGADQRLTSYHLQNAIPVVVAAADREVADTYHRGWFFRQLRAARYYKGEHSHRAAGSRYTLVSPAVVGQRSTPYALE